MAFEGEPSSRLPGEVLLGIDLRFIKAIQRQGKHLKRDGIKGFYDSKMFTGAPIEIVESIELIHENNFANLHVGIHPHFVPFQMGLSLGNIVACDVMKGEGLLEIYYEYLRVSLEHMAKLTPSDAYDFRDFVRKQGEWFAEMVASNLPEGSIDLKTGSVFEQKDKNRILRESAGYAVSIAHTLLQERRIKMYSTKDEVAERYFMSWEGLLRRMGLFTTADLNFDELKQYDDIDEVVPNDIGKHD